MYEIFKISSNFAVEILIIQKYNISFRMMFIVKM